jgi:hypothetical protein
MVDIMPAKSQAQFKKMQVLYSQGKITKKQLDDFDAEENVNYRKLPKRLHPRKRVKRVPRKGRGK